MLEIRCLENLLHYRTPAGRQSGGGLHLWVRADFVSVLRVVVSSIAQQIVGQIESDTMDGVTRRKRPLAGDLQTNRDLM
jgi:hypothetical protein